MLGQWPGGKMKKKDILFFAIGFPLAFMAAGIYSLIVFSLGLKVDEKGRLGYR